MYVLHIVRTTGARTVHGQSVMRYLIVRIQFAVRRLLVDGFGQFPFPAAIEHRDKRAD
jgi:hypothetical protein